MKFKHLSILLLGALLASCSGHVNHDDLKITTPVGAPAVAFYKYAENPNFHTNAAPTNILAMFTEESDQDVLVVDTVGGIKSINKGAPYKVAATITFGNFYIAATGNDTNKKMEKGDKIVLFGKGQTPDLIFHYLYGNEFDDSIEYVAGVQDAAKALTSGKNLVTKHPVSYVFIAQPVLTKILSNKNAPTYGKASVYADVQELYKEKSGGKQLTQASVFVKNSTDTKKIDQFLYDLEKDINKAVKDPSLVSAELNKIGSEEANNLFGIEGNLAEKVLSNNNALGLGFVKAKENKEAIDSFVSIFGLDETSEEIYY